MSSGWPVGSRSHWIYSAFGRSVPILSEACPKTAEIARIHRYLKARAASCPIACRTLGMIVID